MTLGVTGLPPRAHAIQLHSALSDVDRPGIGAETADLQRSGPRLQLTRLPAPAMPPNKFRFAAVLIVTLSFNVTVPADVCGFVVAFHWTLSRLTGPDPSGDVA